MSESAERRFIHIISGEAQGFGAHLTRLGLAIVEPAYAAAMSIRNGLYDRRVLRSHRLARPVVSVGNLTTGGTGKTPVVAWLARHLATQGRVMAILTRGYKGAALGESDEADLLRAELGESAHILVGGDRYKTASAALGRDPTIDVFLMDDGFQHRQLHRDFDLVLIDATNPFGFGHVLPRGLLRERLAGLRRSTAVLITKADQATPEFIDSIIQSCRSATSAAIFRCSHELTRLRIGDRTEPITALAGRAVVAFGGIGNPESFRQLLTRTGCRIVATKWFADHHRYTRHDLSGLSKLARSAHAEMLVTTTKDATRLNEHGESIAIVEMALRFDDDDERRLLEGIESAMEHF